VHRLELGEDRILAEPVDHQGVVAALPNAVIDGALLDAAVLVEDPALGLDGAAKGLEPALRRGGG
jgi:hypothetical protein